MKNKKPEKKRTMKVKKVAKKIGDLG